MVYLQNELAMERMNDPAFSRLIWMPKGLKLKEEEVQQQKFIEMLRTDPEAQKGADLLEMSLEDLKRNIEDKLKTDCRKPVKDTGDHDRLKCIYLIYDQEDFEATKSLEDYLFDQKFEVKSPVFEGEENVIFERHKANLVNCDAAIIFYGKARDSWLQYQLDEFQKATGYGRKSPLLAKAVFCAAPETPQKQRFRRHEIMVFKNYHEFFPESLAPFLEQITKRKEGRQ